LKHSYEESEAFAKYLFFKGLRAGLFQDLKCSHFINFY
jgi:hypothetical protein